LQTGPTEVIHPNRYVAVFFNTEDSYLADKQFRQALTYAIPIKPEGETRSISPINSNTWAYNPQVKPYKYDLESAKRLLTSVKEEMDSFDPTIEITTTLPHLESAELIKEEWLKLGISSAVKVTSYLPEDFQVLLIAQEIPPDPDQYSLWHSTQATNITKYNSPKVDKLLEDGRQTLDKKERILIYHDFQRFLVEDVPAAFLFNHRTFTVTRS
jgi:peptide/nickel transport system substrate-binding protein